MQDYPQIDLSAWTQVGEGYNGQAFISDAHPGKLLKLVHGTLASAEKVEQEFYASQAAFEAGLPTPRVYEIVRNGQDHGYISERIEGKISFSRLCADAPERIPEYAALMARYGHELHAHPLSVSRHVPSLKALLREAVAFAPFVTEAQRRILSSLVDEMADSSTVVHGDFQPGNLILSHDKPYWIDLGWLCVGDPVMDLAHLYKMMMEDSVIPAVQDLTHMTREQMISFWKEFARAYTGLDDLTPLEQKLRPYAALDIVRTYFFHPNEHPQFLAFCKGRMEALAATR
jgi:uncharacterized protein (TIGR02172 family)